MKSGLLASLEEKKISRDTLFKRVAADFSLLPEVIEGLDSSKASVRYGCSKVLVSLSANFPEKLYPYVDVVIARLESDRRILVWNALATTANLATVDANKKIDANYEKIFSFINNEYLVTVANLIDSSVKIAHAKPHLIHRITTDLLRVENLNTTPHLTEECKLVLAEKALKTFNALIDKMDATDKQKVIDFAKRNKNSARKRLNYEAEVFLKKWSNTQ